MRSASVQCAIEHVFDGRTLHEGEPGVIDAQVDACILRCAEREQGRRNIEQGIDIGHAHQAETDLLAADRIRFGVRVMQPQACAANLFRKLRMLLFGFARGNVE